MPQYSITKEEIDFLQSLGSGQSSKDESLYGFIPGEWLPNWVKQGYNQSIEGLAQQVVKGNPVFTLDQDYDPSMIEDIGATVVSFLTPTDIAAMALGGGVGGLALKASTKRAVSQLVKSGLKKELAEVSVSKASAKVLNRARAKAVTGATSLGFYSGLQSALGQQVTDEDISFTTTLKDAAIGAGLGAGVGALGIVSKSAALQRGLGPRQATLVEKGAETAFFGTASPLIEGELPTLDSYIHAAGVIGGLSLSKAAQKKLFKSKAKQLEGDELEAIYRENAEARQNRLQPERLRQEIYTDGTKNVKILTDWTSSQRQETILNIREVNADGTPGKSTNIAKKDFFKPTQEGGYRLKVTKDGKDVDALIRDKSFHIKNELKIDDAEYRGMINEVAGEIFVEKPSGTPSKAKKGIKSTNYDEITGNYEARERLLRQLEKRQAVKNEIADYKKIGVPIYEASGESFFKKWLPPAVYNVLTSLKPLDRRTKDPRFQPLTTEIKGDYFTMSARQAEITQQFWYALNEATYTTKDGKVIRGLKKIRSKAVREELSNDLESNDPEAIRRTADYRAILEAAWKVAEGSGIELAPIENNYLPRKYNQKLKRILREDFERYLEIDPRSMSLELRNKENFEAILKKALNEKVLRPETIEQIERMRAKIAESTKRNISDVSLSESFERIRGEVFSEIVKANKSLTMGRTGEKLDNMFYERDAGTLLTNYIGELAKSVAFAETAGPDGAKLYNKIKAVRDMGGTKESELLYKAINSFTGTIEIDRRFNWSPKAKGVLNDLVNFQVATKIGLGFATVPNLTQSFISSILKAGYAPFFKGTYKMITDTKYRKAIQEYSGAGSLELHAMLAGFNPADASFSSRVADRITRYSGFQGINRINKLVASYTGYEAALKWQKIAKTTNIKARKDWAISNLKGMRIDNVNKKITQKNMARAMFEFSRDTQLQKNVFREPAFFNDPRFQPFVLFKRFGYRQAEWLGKEIRKEVFEHKNAAFILRLGVAGMAGGTFVQWARNGLSDFFAGKDIYDENYKHSVEGEEYGLNDFIDSMAAVGGFGIVSDIMASESKWRALEFAAKPVLIQDAGKAYSALQRLVADIETFGPSWVTAQRAARNVAPVFGSVGRRLLGRLETQGQRKSYVKYRLTKIRPRILDYLIDGNDRMANRLVREWNNSFPERPLTYEDIDVDAINERLMNKYKKEINP
jgi:hypothetical protein